MGACEYPYINSAMDMIAALNKPDFGNFARASKSPACGQCLQLVGPNGTVTVQIVDMVRFFFCDFFRPKMRTNNQMKGANGIAIKADNSNENTRGRQSTKLEEGKASE